MLAILMLYFSADIMHMCGPPACSLGLQILKGCSVQLWGQKSLKANFWKTGHAQLWGK